MSHTYIEQFRKLWGSFNKDNEHLITEKIEDFIEKVRTETLMECRGLLKDTKHENNPKHQKDELWCCIECYEDSVINKEKLKLRTAIDTLIKKETV